MSLLGVTHILDWWHLSMRVRHLEQAHRGVHAERPHYDGCLIGADFKVSRLRHVLWNDYTEEAWHGAHVATGAALDVLMMNGPKLEPSASRFGRHCQQLKDYIWNNEDAIPAYGKLQQQGLPVSTSRAEGCVDKIANARIRKGSRQAL